MINEELSIVIVLTPLIAIISRARKTTLFFMNHLRRCRVPESSDPYSITRIWLRETNHLHAYPRIVKADF